MINNVIVSLDQVTVEWLTAVLATSGALTNGVVASFSVETGQGNWSANASLVLRYAAGSQGAMPQRLFLKMVNADLGDESFGDSEVAYYTRDYVDVDNAPLLRCYDGVYSAERQRYHLLLDDLSTTHVDASEKEPTLEYGLNLAEGLAILHAHWWGAEALGEVDAPIHDAEHIQRFVNLAEPGVGHILNAFPDRLKPHWPDLMRDLYKNHPHALIKRTHNGNGFTLIHGDVGKKNILVPRDGARPLYIIDRQPFDWSLTSWLGVYDIAYAIVLDWNVELRRQSEIPILKRYHQCLIENGVTNYSWQQLYDDYRLCVAMGVYIATEYCRGGVNKKWIHVWLSMLERSLIACDDLACSELW